MQSPDVAPLFLSAPTTSRVGWSRILARAALTAIALGFMGVVVVLPVLAVFAKALEDGVFAYARSIIEADAVAAMRLTLWIALLVVPANTAFGLAAGWAIGKFEFRGKTLLTSLIEVPFAVSPVISGMLFVLAVGPRSVIGGRLLDSGIRIIFAWPGMALATAFVTFGYVARQVITAMEATGRDKEEAALVLGASGWQTFWRVSLPNVRWGLLYGVILCNARAMGEFGGVSVVSGHVRGSTNTLPLTSRHSTTITGFLRPLRWLLFWCSWRSSPWSPKCSSSERSRSPHDVRSPRPVQTVRHLCGARFGVAAHRSRGLVALLGPSGCGKTTLLRILAGLEMADSGTVHFEGVDVTQRRPLARGVGLVFQHYALFEHMTVFENVAFGLRVRGNPSPRLCRA